MKFVADRPYADPEAAARKLIEIANSVEAAQDGRIFIELINWPFLHELKGTPQERDRDHLFDFLHVERRAVVLKHPPVREAKRAFTDL